MSTHQPKRTNSLSSGTSSGSSAGRRERDAGHERQRHVRTSSSDRRRSDRWPGAAAPGAPLATLPGVRALQLPPHFRFLIPILMVALLAFGANLLLAQNGAPHAGQNTVLPTGQQKADPIDTARLAWELIAVVALIFVNALFAIAEYSLITVRGTRIEQLVEENNRSAVLVQRMKSSPDNSTRMMATIQTGVTLLATLSSALAATSAVEPLAAWLSAHSPALIAAHANSVALVLVTLPVAILSLVIGEIAPKSLAYRHAERFALIAVHPVSWMEAVLAPVVALLTFLSNLVVRPFGGTASFTLPAVGKEELEIIMEKGVEQGVVDNSEKEMITGVLDFGDIVARKVMTPRLDLTAFEVGGAIPDLVRLITASGHSRIPIYEQDLDNIVGIIHAKDLLNLLNLPPGEARDRIKIRNVMRPAYFIPETKKVDELLSEFRRSRQQLAIVRDEYGFTAGLVTIEDLLEEIVGDIQDEYDSEEPMMVQVVDAYTSLMDGLTPLSDVNERMDLDLPEDEADTIGGFVFNLLGHQAVQGERARYGQVEFVVEATDGRRITRVRLTREPDGRGAERNGAGERDRAYDPSYDNAPVDTSPPDAAERNAQQGAASRR